MIFLIKILVLIFVGFVLYFVILRFAPKKALKHRICPKCKSKNIGITGGSQVTMLGAFFPVEHECLDCGYTSIIFPEKEE
jgi:hypothetical protein